MRDKKSTKNVPRLMKWRFKQDEKGDAGEVRYWWSNGSKTTESMASYADAVARLKTIQDNGGLRPVD